LSLEKFHIRFFREELTGKEISIMDAFNDNGSGVIHQPMGATVTNGGVRFMQMTQDVLIAFDTFPFTVFVFSVELCANVLPGGGSQDIAFVVKDR
jgi:hypothetical protein